MEGIFGNYNIFNEEETPEEIILTPEEDDISVVDDLEEVKEAYTTDVFEYASFVLELQETTNYIIEDSINFTKKQFLEEVSKEDVKNKALEYTNILKEIFAKIVDKILTKVNEFKDVVNINAAKAFDCRKVLNKNSKYVNELKFVKPMPGYDKTLDLTAINMYVDKYNKAFNDALYIYSNEVEDIIDSGDMTAEKLYKEIHGKVFGNKVENFWAGEKDIQKTIKMYMNIVSVSHRNINKSTYDAKYLIKQSQKRFETNLLKYAENGEMSPEAITKLRTNLSRAAKDYIVIIEIQKTIYNEVFVQCARVLGSVVKAIDIHESVDMIEEDEDDIIDFQYESVLTEHGEILQEIELITAQSSAAPPAKVNKVKQFAQSVITWISDMCTKIAGIIRDFVQKLKEKFKQKDRAEWIANRINTINASHLTKSYIFARITMIEGFYTMNSVLENMKSNAHKLDFKFQGLDLYKLFENKHISTKDIEQMSREFKSANGENNYITALCCGNDRESRSLLIGSYSQKQMMDKVFGEEKEVFVPKQYILECLKHYGSLDGAIQSFEKVALPKISEVNNEIKNIEQMIRSIDKTIESKELHREMVCLELILAYNKSVYNYFNKLITFVALSVQTFDATVKKATNMWVAGAFAVDKGYDVKEYVKSKFNI